MIMKKNYLLMTGLATLLITGCQTAGDDPEMLQRAASNRDMAQPFNQLDAADNDYNSYGYTRYQRTQIEPNNQQQYIPIVNREELSDGIARLVLTNDDVHEAGALVTDKYALVAYTTDSEDRDFVADQVKRSALSIVPRYYDVYITDDPNHFDEIERFEQLSTATPEVNNTIEQTIDEMLTSPQGHYDEELDANHKVLETHRDNMITN